MTHLHTRSRCDECDRPASIQVDEVFLCESCEAIVLATLFNSVTSGASSRDVNVSAVIPVPCPMTVGTANSRSCGDVKESSASIPEYNGVKSPALLTAHGLSGKSCPLSRSETGPQELNFEAEVAALEAEWASHGIIKNSTTLFVTQDNRSQASSRSSSVA